MNNTAIRILNTVKQVGTGLSSYQISKMQGGFPFTESRIRYWCRKFEKLGIMHKEKERYSLITSIFVINGELIKDGKEGFMALGCPYFPVCKCNKAISNCRFSIAISQKI